MNAPTGALTPSLISSAEAMQRQAFEKLPNGYFDRKSARTYLFNNVTRLVARHGRKAEQSAPALHGHVADQLAAAGRASLYVGVPWCEQICSFCNFAYTTETRPEQKRRYVAQLARELELLKSLGLEAKELSSVYFGGGTPTATPDDIFEDYLSQVLREVRLGENASITCEGTVATLSDEKLQIMKRIGVTRLSTGLQTLDDEIRQRARLLLSGDEALEAVRRAHGVFEMFNVDLIYGHPYQSPDAWASTVRRVAELQLPSITLYRLEVKDRTMELKRYANESANFASEPAARLQYFIARILLEAAGYVECPLGWWIRQDRHLHSENWRGHMRGWASTVPYFGIGQGAFSLTPGAYWDNHMQLRGWEEALAADILPIKSLQLLPPAVSFLNHLFRAFRTVYRVDLAEIAEPAGQLGLASALRNVLDRQVEWGLLDREDDVYRLTVGGAALVHWIFDDISAEVAGLDFAP